MSDLLPIDRGTGQPITPTIVKLKVFAFGSGQKALFAKAAVVIDETNVILRSLIGEEINKEKKDLCFSEDDHISKVVSAVGLDLIDLLNFPISLQPPMDTVANRFSQMNLDGRAVEIVDWPDEVNEIVNALKEIEPGFDTSVRSWGQFKSKFPVLYEWFNNHVRHHEYLSEISICDSKACTVCRKLGRNVRTPDTKDGCLRELTLRHMDRPIADRSNVGHFVPPSQTKAVTLKKKMTFDQLKAELPTLDKHPHESDIVKEKAVLIRMPEVLHYSKASECEMWLLVLLVIKFAVSMECILSEKLVETYQRTKWRRG